MSLRILFIGCLVILGACGSGERPVTGLDASASGSGTVKAVTGPDPYDAAHAASASGTIDVKATDVGDRWSQLQNIDLVDVRADVTIGSDRYAVVIDRAMPRHPAGAYTTWSGVALGHAQHGDTGIGTPELPRVEPEISLWGWARVTRNGAVIAAAAPAHVMVMSGGPLKGVHLVVGDEDRSLIGAPDGYLSVAWSEVRDLSLPSTERLRRQLLGLGVLLVLFLASLWLATTDARAPARAAREAA